MFAKRKVRSNQVNFKICFYCDENIDSGYEYSCTKCKHHYHETCKNESSCQEEVLECGCCDKILDCYMFNYNVCPCCKTGFCRKHLSPCSNCDKRICYTCLTNGYEYDTFVYDEYEDFTACPICTGHQKTIDKYDELKERSDINHCIMTEMILSWYMTSPIYDKNVTKIILGYS